MNPYPCKKRSLASLLPAAPEGGCARRHTISARLLTPDLQLILGPAGNSEEDMVWVAGLRYRLTL